MLLSGEPGIGKSRLVEVLRERVIRQGATRMVFRCSPYHQQSALFPVIEHVQRVVHWQHDAPPEVRVDALEQALQGRRSRLSLEEVVPLLAALLSLPHPAHYPPLNLTPQRQRQKTYDALVAWLLAEAEQQPVLAVWEDLHWADPSTLELLGLVLDQVPTARMLTLLTCRPEFLPPWASRSHLTQVTLTRLGRPQVQAMITSLTGGKTLPAAVVEHIVARTDGVPLFVEELVKMILESGLVREEGDHYVLTAPCRLWPFPRRCTTPSWRDWIAWPRSRRWHNWGPRSGRTFAYELLQAVSPLDEATLQQGLRQLIEAELVYQRGTPPQATYMFKHALIQETAYQSLLRSTRQQFHQRIAQVLEARFPATVETQPELLAHHYTEAGLAAQAVVYWQRAGERAVERSANVEAISHLTTALTLLPALPDTPERTQHELTLLTVLGIPLVLTKGHAAPEVEATYARARTLCQQLGDTPQLFAVLLGLRRMYFMRAEYQTAHAVGEQLLRLAERLDDAGLCVRAHMMLAEGLLYLGEFAPARAHAEQGIALYDPQRHRVQVVHYGNDPGVCCRFFAALALWVLGYPDQAQQRSEEALAWAQELAHPFSRAFASSMRPVSISSGEGALTYTRAEAGIALATAQGFVLFLAHGPILRGWALAEQGQAAEGLAQIRQGIAAKQAIGVESQRSSHLALLADVYGKVGQLDEGLRVLTEAQTVAQATGERFYEAELSRLTGELLRAQSSENHAAAEACFQQALDLARRQQAKSWELRAAMSLSRLWQRQGKRREAHQLLAEVYGWFTEGFDTADLQEAKALLVQLA